MGSVAKIMVADSMDSDRLEARSFAFPSITATSIAWEPLIKL